MIGIGTPKKKSRIERKIVSCVSSRRRPCAVTWAREPGPSNGLHKAVFR